MGIHKLSRLENYWSSDPLLGVNAISDVVSSKRLKKITQALHINDNSAYPPRDSPNYDKLYNPRPQIDHLNVRNKRVYKCSSVLSVGESMIVYKGRGSFKQYLPMKPIERL